MSPPSMRPLAAFSSVDMRPACLPRRPCDALAWTSDLCTAFLAQGTSTAGRTILYSV